MGKLAHISPYRKCADDGSLMNSTDVHKPYYYGVLLICSRTPYFCPYLTPLRLAALTLVCSGCIGPFARSPGVLFTRALRDE